MSPTGKGAQMTGSGSLTNPRMSTGDSSKLRDLSHGPRNRGMDTCFSVTERWGSGKTRLCVTMAKKLSLTDINLGSASAGQGRDGSVCFG